MIDAPKCTCNKYNKDGNLIEYIGDDEPCILCKEKESCFKKYMKFVYDRRYPINENLLFEKQFTLLDILEAWRKWVLRYQVPYSPDLSRAWDMEYDIINQLRENPELIKYKGLKDGWLK